MTDEAALLRAITDAPDDDAPRLVYADCLEERGDPDRAEFIRVQCDLAGRPEADDRWADLAARERLLLDRHGAAWAGPLGPWCDWWEFRRGFVERARLRHTYSSSIEPDFLICLAELAARTPVREVHWRPTPEDVGRLAASPLLARLSAVGIATGNQATPDEYLAGIARLAESPHAGGLSAFQMFGHVIGDGIARTFAQPGALPGLNSLTLTTQWLTDAALDALGGSPLGGRLRRLWCAINPAVTRGGVERLLDGAPRLTGLDVSVDGWGEAGLGPLARSGRLARLTRLALYSGVPDPYDGIERTDARRLAGVMELLAGEGVPALTDLALTGIELTGEDLRVLAAGPLGRQLSSLTLERCRLVDADVAALSGLTEGGQLRRLGLPYNALTDAAAEYLAGSPGLGRLHVLDLEDNLIDRAGAEALANSPYRHPGTQVVTRSHWVRPRAPAG